MIRFSPAMLAFCLGAAAFALIAGALGFQYLDHLPPCEMCMWQRYPHIAAACVGLAGAVLIRIGVLPDSFAPAALAALLIAVSGGLGVYHAGVEWQWWKGPQQCTGSVFQFSGPLDLNAPVARCDRAAWRLFGLSLAGYNALLSLTIAALGVSFIARERRP